MNHLIVSREFPPSSYAQGGIGTYAAHIARLLAEAGETVHVIGERWRGAPDARLVLCGGRLIVHRVPLDEPLLGPDEAADRRILRAMRRSAFPAQAFSWQVARLAESLVQEASIDCIEGQEYEAPLYYLLLRRALGLGPERMPPCFVHLHSPMQLICHYNDWDLGRSDHLTAKRLEDYVIQAADAALCPSRYLARQVERHYGLDAGSVEQIPLPRGDTPLIERTIATWQSGTICYVGRMEPRKGVFEWVDAAVRVARKHPGVRFELIGADTSPANAWPASVRSALRARVPSDLADSIVFIDAMPRPALRGRLARARIAVVPSRWENYPNTCVEAMATGLPVLSTPHGGMIEMVEDGRNGWLAADASPEALAATLCRALDTPPEALARMGKQAAADIHRLCDNRSIVERHLEFRARVASASVTRSTSVPKFGSSTVLFGRQADLSTSKRVSETGSGLVLVVEIASLNDVHDAVADLCAQTHAPAAVVVDAPGMSDAERDEVERRLRDARIVTVSRDPDRTTDAFQRALAVPAQGVAIRASGCRLEPRFVEACVGVFARVPDAAVVSHWHRTGTRPDEDCVPQIPARPYQWILNDVSPCAAFRSSAVTALGSYASSGGHISTGDLALALLCDGWGGITFPAFLSRRIHRRTFQQRSVERAMSAQRRRAIEDSGAGMAPEDGLEVLAIVRGSTAIPLNRLRSLRTLLRLPIAEQVGIAARLLAEPRVMRSWFSFRKR
jgi:glycosyltransferase involved in cell wall biosynthesis